jgi:hypothetical protein
MVEQYGIGLVDVEWPGIVPSAVADHYMAGMTVTDLPRRHGEGTSGPVFRTGAPPHPGIRGRLHHPRSGGSRRYCLAAYEKPCLDLEGGRAMGMALQDPDVKGDVNIGGYTGIARMPLQGLNPHVRHQENLVEGYIFHGMGDEDGSLPQRFGNKCSVVGVGNAMVERMQPGPLSRSDVASLTNSPDIRHEDFRKPPPVYQLPGNSAAEGNFASAWWGQTAVGLPAVKVHSSPFITEWQKHTGRMAYFDGG